MSKDGIASHFLLDDRKVRLIVAAGLLGMLLILLGNLFPGDAGSPERSEPGSSAEYVSQTEEKLCNILSHVRGVGRVSVLVTLESGETTIYAVNENQSGEAVSTYANGTVAREEESEKLEQSYLLVDTGSGKSPLVISNTAPVVRGVVVVCSGAGEAVVRKAVLDAVTTALGIDSNRVCVLQASA